MNLFDQIKSELEVVYGTGEEILEEGIFDAFKKKEDLNKYIIVRGSGKEEVKNRKDFVKALSDNFPKDKKAEQDKRLLGLLDKGGEEEFTLKAEAGKPSENVIAKVELDDSLAAPSGSAKKAADKADKAASKLDSKYKFSAQVRDGVVKIYMGSKEIIGLPSGTVAKQAFADMMKQIEEIASKEA